MSGNGNARVERLAAGDRAAEQFRGCVVAIGNFDGLHRGHQQLLNIAGSEADRLKSSWGIVTFDPHPRAVFRPDEPLFQLTQLEVKARLVGMLGGDLVAAIRFDRELAAMPAKEFVQSLLVDGLGVSHVVTGYDFHFGRGREGSPQTMQALGEELGFGVTVVPQVTADDGLAPFSSSAIRSKLRHGRVREAAGELGYWWTLMSTVVEGDRRGRTIGFPTANFQLEQGNELPDGIYAVRVRDPNEPAAPVWAGAGYVGSRPTFETERRFLEIFLLDFNQDIYGRELAIEFIDFIRPDRKFDSVEELTSQMNADCDRIRKVLADADENAPFPGTLSPFPAR